MNADISIMNHYLKPLTSVCTKNFPMMIPFTEITSKKVLLKVNLIKIGTLEKTEKNTYTLPLFSLILRASHDFVTANFDRQHILQAEIRP